MQEEKSQGGSGTSRQGVAGGRPTSAPAGILPFVLGFTAPFVVAVGSRLLLAHAEKVARDVAPLLVIAVFASFATLALRRLPGRRLMVEIFVVWWLTAPAVFAGILLDQVWRNRRRSP